MIMPLTSSTPPTACVTPHGTLTSCANPWKMWKPEDANA